MKSLSCLVGTILMLFVSTCHAQNWSISDPIVGADLATQKNYQGQSRF